MVTLNSLQTDSTSARLDINWRVTQIALGANATCWGSHGRPIRWRGIFVIRDREIIGNWRWLVSVQVIVVSWRIAGLC